MLLSHPIGRARGYLLGFFPQHERYSEMGGPPVPDTSVFGLCSINMHRLGFMSGGARKRISCATRMSHV